MNSVYTPTYTRAYPTTYNQSYQQVQQPDVMQYKDKNAPLVLQYMADDSGCALYRMGNPGYYLNFTGKSRVFNSSIMIKDANFYAPISVVRIQRQAKDEQREFVDELCRMRDVFKFKLQYEIDDIVFGEDIPEYNVNRKEFLNPKIRSNIEYIMDACDEITVTCKFMRDYYRSKLNNQKITIIPNFQPKFWFDRFYDQIKINKEYDKNKNRPRILYCGSAGHYDLHDTGHPDDLTHVIDAIQKTANDFQWVFFGTYPRQLDYMVQSGKIEFHKFVNLMDYPAKLASLNVQAAIAPLANNNFNKAKSNIKWTELCALGIPCICQNLCTYEDALWKFDTGDEMIDQLKDVVGKAGHYKNLGVKLRKIANNNWLDNSENIGCYVDLFKYEYGSSERKFLNRFNND